MNRERGCIGANSYAKELFFNPVEFLEQRLRCREYIAWLDLCCGTGEALIEAAKMLQPSIHDVDLRMVGVDLAGMFHAYPSTLDFLNLEERSVSEWEPSCSFDLITCVHGLHYIGDKLELVARAVSWLKEDGIFLAHLDPMNLKFATGESAGREILKELRRQGVEYNSRRHLLYREGGKDMRLGYEYIGADDRAGPNYTKQEAVDSYYRPAKDSARR